MRLDDDIRTVLAAAETDGNALRLTGQLDRKTYVKVAKAIEAAGGKWNRKTQAHLFDGDAATITAALLQADAVVPERSADQFFPTPPAAVDELIALADLKPWHAVLEPSAGRGAIASRVAPLVRSVACVEIREKYAADIRAAGYAVSLEVADFLTVEPSPAFDRVVMNPPFTKGAEVRHVQHALRFLKPGGLLVSVMTTGVTQRSDRLSREFREIAAEVGGRFQELPSGAFAESGTGVNTVIAVIPAQPPAELKVAELTQPSLFDLEDAS